MAALESLRGKGEGSGGRRKIERDQIMKEHLDNGTNLRFLESFFLLPCSIRAVNVRTQSITNSPTCVLPWSHPRDQDLEPFRHSRKRPPLSAFPVMPLCAARGNLCARLSQERLVLPVLECSTNGVTRRLLCLPSFAPQNVCDIRPGWSMWQYFQ